MAWYDYANPAYDVGAVYSGVTGNANPIPTVDQAWGDLKGALKPDTSGVKAAYDQAMAQSQANGAAIRDFLLGQQGKAQAYFSPLQKMFSAAYGTQGIQAPVTPGAPGNALAGMRAGGR